MVMPHSLCQAWSVDPLESSQMMDMESLPLVEMLVSKFVWNLWLIDTWQLLFLQTPPW
jgi:hypothetical protein